jgi:hypothetical protein
MNPHLSCETDGAKTGTAGLTAFEREVPWMRG